MEFLGSAEVSPQDIRGGSGDAVWHEDPPVQSQGGIDQWLAQGPGYHGGEPPGIARAIQDKYGVRILDNILQP